MAVETTIIWGVSELRRRRMKWASLIAAVLLLGIAIPSFAQQAGTTQGGSAADTSSGYAKDVYYKVVPLLKVWTGQLGYVVTFFNSSSQVQTVYIPLTWFNNGPASKADLVYALGANIPYMTVFWADGKFDHVALYVSSDIRASSNGVLSESTDNSKQFDVQEIPRSF
jgi:hypothetical protein